jgi:glutamine amidotransferase
MIGIINYGSGNIQAIGNIYNRLQIPFVIVEHPAELARVDRIILPGVGAFDQAMNELQNSGMRGAMEEAVFGARKPFIGICVGMQLLARGSEEGVAAGLGWIDGFVKRFGQAPSGKPLRLPHMGWNTVELLRPSPLFRNVDFRSGYYFLHSYYFDCDHADDRLVVAEYGQKFTACLQKDNIFGVQFHPEKSHHAGVQLLKNFALSEDLVSANNDCSPEQPTSTPQ